MKNIIKISFLLALLLSISGYAQHKISSKKEVGKFQTLQNNYIGKTVKELLKDLDIPISSVQLSGGNSEENNMLILRFNDRKEYNKMASENSSVKPSIIFLYIKENNPNTNKLFMMKKTDSLPTVLQRNNLIKTNQQLLKDYLELTIIKISAKSEQ